MVHYKLRYFDLRGLAEPIRQLFALAGVKYEDDRITLEEWIDLKERDLFGTLPIFEEDGNMLGQSAAIARYIAGKYGFSGKDAWEAAQVDSIVDQFKDFIVEIRPYMTVRIKFREGNEEQLRHEIFMPATKKHLPFLVKFLKNSGSGFLVGNSLTWVDLFVAEYLRTFKAESDVFEEVPELVQHWQKIHAIPKIQKWREERPKSIV